MAGQNKIPFEKRLAKLNLTKDDFYALVKMGATLDGLENKRHNLCLTIYRKLKAREHAYKLQYFFGVLARLSDERQRPSPDDKITNPYAIRDPYNHPENNGCAVYGTVAEKRLMFNRAIEEADRNKDKGPKALLCGGKEHIPLGAHGAGFNDVEKIGGLWRVQNNTQYDTISVQKRDFTLLDTLDRTEHTNFEYYLAASVGWTGFGRACNNKPDYIVAKYETGRGTFYAYGCQSIDGQKKALATARAHLAGQVYLAYQDLIIADTIRADNAAKHSEKKKDLFQGKYELISVQVQEDKPNLLYSGSQEKMFALLGKLDRMENTNFEYYTAAQIDLNYRYDILAPDYIIAKFKTGRGTFYAYGCQLIDGKQEALATARAHLSVRVYDAYQDMIEAQSRQELMKQK